jgi:hypothetical protein
VNLAGGQGRLRETLGASAAAIREAGTNRSLRAGRSHPCATVPPANVRFGRRSVVSRVAVVRHSVRFEPIDALTLDDERSQANG